MSADKTFADWFKLLVKNNMAIAAIPISGIALGYAIIQLSRICPEKVAERVGELGYELMRVSTFAFMLAIGILLVIFTLRDLGLLATPKRRR